MKRSSTLLLAAVAMATAAGTLTGCGVPAAKGPADSFGLDFSMPAGSQTGGAVIFIVDGVNAVTFQELLDAGELPAIKTYLVDRGLYVPRAASGNPSLTMNNLTSIMTGLFSGHHGLVGAKVFDRNRLIFRNYETLQDKNKLDDDCPAPTLYQQFPDCPTFSLFLQKHGGATHFFENRMSAGPPMAFGWYDLVDRTALYRFRDVMDCAREYRQFPAVVGVYQLSVNFAAYTYEASSPQYRQAIREMDFQIGRVLGDMKRAGVLDKTLVAFISDHGHCDTPNHGKTIDFMASLGISMANDDPIGEEMSFEKRLKHYNKFAAVPYGAGDRYWTLYLRKPVGTTSQPALADWLQRPTPAQLRAYPSRGGPRDLPALLAALNYVDAVAYLAAPDCVRIVRKGGEVEFRRTHIEGAPAGAADGSVMMSYHVISGKDPLEWEDKLPAAALAGKPLTSRRWLEATAGTEYPDLPAGLLSYFDGIKAADIVVFPMPTWDFDGWRKAGHGGIRAAEVFAEMVIAGPGIPHGRIPVARTVDLMPTLLEAMGKPVPAGLDGESLIGRVGEQKKAGP